MTPTTGVEKTSSSNTVKTEKTNIASDSSSAELLTAAGRLAARISKRESAAEKGLRYLLQGRLQVVKVDPDSGLIIARCKGDTEGRVYWLGHEPEGDPPWRCTCPAHGPCSHLYALWRVTEVGR